MPPILGYFGGYENHLKEFLRAHHVEFQDGPQSVNWEFHHGDFPALLNSQKVGRDSRRATFDLSGSARGDARPTKVLPAPHAILFDAFSPAKNPAMWTLPLFTNLFQLLDPQRPCALPTYSRSTILRVTLLLAGFFVGVGHATGEKEETTIAANNLNLIFRTARPPLAGARKTFAQCRADGGTGLSHSAVERGVVEKASGATAVSGWR